MKTSFSAPTAAQVPVLQALWEQAFCDEAGFRDLFFSRCFSPECCRCAVTDGETAAALYWFDVQSDGQKLAYIYAVATDERLRGHGLCRALMADTHALLRARGYAGALLSPESEGLAQMYKKFGYTACVPVREFTARAAGEPLPLTKLTPAQYLAARESLLPPSAVRVDERFLELLAYDTALYRGDGFVLAARRENESLFCTELLGHADPGRILVTLNAADGIFRTPGQVMPLVLFCPLSPTARTPDYFPLVLD